MCRRSRVYQGTGWSTQIPSYNPLQIIENLRRKIEGKEMEKIAPWYRGLQGPILRKKGSPSYVSIGLVEKVQHASCIWLSRSMLTMRVVFVSHVLCACCVDQPHDDTHQRSASKAVDCNIQRVLGPTGQASAAWKEGPHQGL
jgi:hypothetical protein